MKRALLIGLAALCVGMLALPASAAVTETTAPEGFTNFGVENPLTSANAQNHGWRYTADLGLRDVAIVDHGIGDSNSLRISNAYTDGSFGNWLYSQRLTTPVTEDANGNEFVAEFQFQSETDAYQPGLQVSVSPQSAFGDRMSFLRFRDSNDGANGGIDVYFVDNQDNDGQAQREVQIANNLSRTDAHNIKIVLDLYTGAHNDVANVYIDGSGPLVPPAVTGFDGFFAPVDHPDTMNKVKAGQSVPMKWKIGSASLATTWEDFYQAQDGQTRGVDSLIFQARTSGGEAFNTLGHGFLFDNVKLSSGDTGTLPVTTGALGDASVYADPIFTAKQVTCDTAADIDLLEQVATPGASQLTYDAATGVWHYNWQTTNTMKNTCVKLTLNLTGDYALFKIVK